MYIATIGCIVSIALYAITIIVGLFLKRKLFDDSIGSAKSEMTAGEVANAILTKYGFGSEIDNNEEDNNEEDIDEESNEDDETEESNADEVGKPRFNFNATNEEIDEKLLSSINATTYETVDRIDDKIQTYGVNYGDGNIFLSSDIYDSKSLDAIGIAAYQAMSLVCECDETKPAKFSLISFLTAIPRCILQVGWLAAVIPFLGVLSLSVKTVLIVNIIVIVAFLLNLLSLLYPKYIAEKTVEELISEQIIGENEVEIVYETTNVLANKTATSCFGFLRWFLKLMGYDV